METVFKTLDGWTQQHPEKLLFSFLDLGGRESDNYSYQSFHERTNAIATYLRCEVRFGANDRILLAYPPGLEMMCAFFGCARAGLIPVPVYPLAAHGFQAALYKMAHIANDCGAAAVLTTTPHKTSLAEMMLKNGCAGSSEGSFVSSLNWISTTDITEPVSNEVFPQGEILFLQYTSGSTSHPKGVMVTHENVLHNRGLVVDHPAPVALSWLPQYHDMGLIGYYIYSALSGGTTYGFSPFDFIQRPALWIESIKKYRATATSAPNFAFDYCLRPGKLQEEAMQTADLSSLRFLMTAAEPVHAGTYMRFLRTFQPYGLKPEAFVVAYGLAENTLAVSNYGRRLLSVNSRALALRSVRITSDVSEIVSAKQIISCGKPLGDVAVRIVDPDKHVALADGNVGEIWVAGRSKCSGYWNKRELTQATFRARIVGESHHAPEYLRTGDLGFLREGELYVCGRIKDMIIVRGQNYYPQDIERIVEEAFDSVRKSCVVAFEINEDHEPGLAVVAEVKSARSMPDAREVAAAVRNHLNIETSCIAFVPPKSIPKTSSGKLMRSITKQMWLEGKFRVLGRLSREDGQNRLCPDACHSLPFETLRRRYNLRGTETHSLLEAGMDSLDLVILMHEIQELLREKGAHSLASEIDVRLIQCITVAELCRLADLFEQSPENAVLRIRKSLEELLEEHHRAEEQLMRHDRKVTSNPASITRHFTTEGQDAVLLTGGSGFVGPFLLSSLLEQTTDDIYVLIRAENESRGRARLLTAFESLEPATEQRELFNRRVIPVLGNLEEMNLGLTHAEWHLLSDRVHTVYHNGASVNYVFNYQKLRAANVNGTNELLRFAFECGPKTFNYISTTFIFGWAVKEVLYETDCNKNMELLDFGYSQSKWVAEQIVLDAMRVGLPGRIFRPALVSPSVMGTGNNLDIAIRLLAFMVNHGIGVDALNQVSFVPVDVAAANIVGISNVSETVNRVFHVTRDKYANMVDITKTITRLTGQEFELFSLPAFVPEVIRRCSKDDPLFPLLDFLIGSIDSIASMEFKRYDSSAYQTARALVKNGIADPSLDDTVLGILRFMKRKGLISVGIGSGVVDRRTRAWSSITSQMGRPSADQPVANLA